MLRCAQFVISLLMNEGDSVLVERYTYSHLIDNVINFKGYADHLAHAFLLIGRPAPTTDATVARSGLTETAGHHIDGNRRHISQTPQR